MSDADRPSQFFEHAFQASPVGMLVVDGAGTIVELNACLGELFGYPRAELLGASVELLVGESSRPGHARLRDLFVVDPKVRPMGNGRELLARHKDGFGIPVEIGLTPMRVGAQTFVLATVVDLSERKRAAERFRLAIEAAPNGMLMVDAKGTIELVNRQIEKVFGYEREELVGLPVETLLPERMRGHHGAFRDGYFANPGARPMGAGRELFGRRKDGSEVPVEIGLSPVPTPTGHLVLASIVDITERTHAQEAIRRSLTEKEFLLRELHHRAKNNLQLISSILHLASSQPEHGVLDILAECRERIGAISLVHDQLYQTGTFSSLSIHAYLSSLTEQVALAWRRNEGIRVELLPGEVSLALDQAIPLGLVVNELLTNAFKHAFVGRETGRIEVRCAPIEGGRVILSVSDDGLGLDASVRAPGAHLGLDLVRALARQLRASLEFETRGGTRVTLRFTPADRPVSDAAAAPKPAPAGGTAG